MSLWRVLLQPVSVRCCAKDVQARPLNEGLGSFHIAIRELSLRLAPGRQAAYVQRWAVFASNKALRVAFVVALMPRDRPAQTLDEVHTDVIPKILLRPEDICHRMSNVTAPLRPVDDCV
jgi:hypothetical protein